MKVEIHNLFPTPIFLTNIEREFTKEELDFVKKNKELIKQNVGNVSTRDTYILQNPEFTNINNFLIECCKEYLKTIICTSNDIELYITQSWLNYTNESEYHHLHSHPNSIISGVLYFNSNKENDSIKFENPLTSSGRQLIRPEKKEYNVWNSDTWTFAVETGQLIMFPSSIAHSVDTKVGKNLRTSLAFNTFYRGTFGNNQKLWELIL